MASDPVLTYLALGGAGEIGMNMYLYGYGPAGKERYILVDTGLTFPDMDGQPGVDLIMPDPAFIAKRADRLDGILITHAHEDHVGALGHLMPQLNAPVFARRFTAAIAREKLKRSGLSPDLVQEAPAWPETVDIGPFKVGFVPLSHSIPEASALVIDTPAGRIVHSGDFKLDETPLVGEPFDASIFADIGSSGVKAFACDSTNVFSMHAGRSEATLVEPLGELMREASGMVVATTFASNIARLKTLASAAADAGRSVVVLGRAMNTMLETAVKTGILTDFPSVTPVKEASGIPRDNLFLLVTGSQGERRAASAQLAQGSYQGMSLKPGDLFLFSSKTIPGNEVSVARILNQLSEMQIDTVDDSDGRYHVSGHANRPDLERMRGLLKASIVIPMHGEHRHLRAHARLADAEGAQGFLAPNGAIVDLTGDKAKIIDHVETGRVYLDGTVLIGAMDGVVRDRMRMALRGHAVVSIMLEDSGQLSDGVWIETSGLPDGDANGGLAAHLESKLDGVLSSTSAKDLRDDGAVEKLVVRVIGNEAQTVVGKKPVVTVLINRFE